MTRYIDADEFVKRVVQYPRQSTKTIGLALADTPTADVVEWKSPIQMITDDIIKDIKQKQGELIMELVHRVEFNIDKDELVKALNYDRDQYEKGYADGRLARDSEIVRCKDCIHRNKYKCNNITLGSTKRGVTDDWYCADGERKETENNV